MICIIQQNDTYRKSAFQHINNKNGDSLQRNQEFDFEEKKKSLYFALYRKCIDYIFKLITNANKHWISIEQTN